MDTLKNEFEAFLCERNDVIDNAAYDLAAAIYKNEKPDAVKEAASGLFKALLFQPDDAIIAPEKADQLIEYARKILTDHNLLNEEKSSGRADAATDLSWDMHYIAEIIDDAEFLLEDKFPVCHPYFSGEDCDVMCIDDLDCKNKCALRCARH